MIGSIGTRTVALGLALFLILMPSLPAFDSPIGKQAFAFSVEDQFGTTWTWDGNFKGKAVLMFISDRKGREYTENWTKPLRAAVGNNVEFVPFANVSSAPFFLKSFIRGKIRDAYQHPLLLDWKGDISEYYHCREDVTNLILIDKNNTVRFFTAGKGDGTEVQHAIQEIKKNLGI